MAVLDAILSPEWQYRYHSYNSEWAEDEEFFEMRNGEGDQLLILFSTAGAVINGLAEDEEAADMIKLEQVLPAQFHEFMFGEPVHSAGTSFCLWQLSGQQDWQTTQPPLAIKASEELLSPLNADPLLYKTWADNYFENEGLENGLPLEVIRQIFAHQPLNKEMILDLAPAFTDWDQLEEDLQEISYQYHI